MMIKVFYLNC